MEISGSHIGIFCSVWSLLWWDGTCSVDKWFKIDVFTTEDSCNGIVNFAGIQSHPDIGWSKFKVCAPDSGSDGYAWFIGSSDSGPNSLCLL